MRKPTLKHDHAKKKFTTEEIKKWDLEEKGIDKFELFRSEVINLARQIQIWLTIANAKEKFKKLKYEDFWGWTQQIPTLRLIAIDGVKICDGIKYIKSVIENNIGTEHYINLLNNSRLLNRFKSVRKIIEPLKPARNKRYAHLENQEIKEFKCNLQDLLISLINLDDSLGYISHYLLNPRYIINEEWDVFTINEVTEITESSSLIEYLKNDRIILGCNTILRELNENENHSLAGHRPQNAITL